MKWCYIFGNIIMRISFIADSSSLYKRHGYNSNGWQSMSSFHIKYIIHHTTQDVRQRITHKIIQILYNNFDSPLEFIITFIITFILGNLYSYQVHTIIIITIKCLSELTFYSSSDRMKTRMSNLISFIFANDGNQKRIEFNQNKGT